MATRQKSKAAQAWHRDSVYKDPEFIAELEALPKRNSPPDNVIEDYRRIAEQFGIDWTYVDFVHDRDWSDFKPTKNVGGIVTFNEDSTRFIADLDLNVTEDQILDVFQQILGLRKQYKVRGKRYRAPEYTQLLYAIFKAKSKGVDFREIFRLYQDSALPYYEAKPGTHFKSRDELERYYLKHYF